ncbi:hypothetical protein M0802_012177 [Mischocyttarus mexicanus]|nr:hypothetical protein M0802_012177 [Mischocyttarus mexicanus]
MNNLIVLGGGWVHGRALPLPKGTYISTATELVVLCYPTTQSLLHHQLRDMRLPVPFLLSCVSLVAGQYNSRPYQVTTPVPILKQINNYSYGYEAADGSYKIESKYPTGEVYGKYGFVDDTGSVREIEYGASRRGFEPVGAGINVPPPTLTSSNSIANGPEDDGQYREDPSVYYTDPRFTNGERYEPRPPSNQPYSLQRRPPFNSPSFSSSSSLPSNPQPIAPRVSASQSEVTYQPQYQPQYQGQQGQGRSLFTPMAYRTGYQGHPEPNIVSSNAGTASYTINYKR